MSERISIKKVQKRRIRMKRERNELMEFLLGAGMLAAGLYLFCNRVTVVSGLFTGMIRVGGFNIASGLCIVPLIFGIILIFYNPSAFIGKLVTILGVIVIIAAIIASTRIYMPSISLYEWLLYLVLIFGGGTLLARVLFAKPKNKDKDEWGRD